VISDAMVEQISSRGIAATRVADVAAAMGVSTGLILAPVDRRLGRRTARPGSGAGHAGYRQHLAGGRPRPDVEGNTAGEFSCRDPEVSAARITALLDGLAVQR
jgi:hypothetical protein